MRTIYYTASSLDGYIADEHNSLEWLFQCGEPPSSYREFIAGVGALAMGSTSYEWMLANVVRIHSDRSEPWPYELPTWIFTTRSLPGVAGADLRFVSGDVRPVHRQMSEAAGGKNIWLVGGGDLVGQFHDHGLLDELIVQLAPVTLSGGAPLLPRRIATPPLRLTSVRAFGDAFAELRYEVPRRGAATDALRGCG